MPKKLKDILGADSYLNLHGRRQQRPDGSTFIARGDEQEFIKKQVGDEIFDNVYASDEYDALFSGSNIKTSRRGAPERHGYDHPDDKAVYENCAGSMSNTRRLRRRKRKLGQ